MKALAILQQQLAPYGVLRAAVNLSNPLLIKSRDPLTGVSPSLAIAIAARLEVPLQLVEYDHPDDICTAAEEAAAATVAGNEPKTPWDIALIAADPDRASVIDFTPAYCEIRATCMVPESSPIVSFADVDRDGVRVSVKGGGAYDLWLTRNWKKATFVRSRTLDASYDAYVHDSLEALAGLRPRLLDDLQRSDGESHRILDGSFMSVQQAIGCLKISNPMDHSNDDAAISPGHAFLSEFVEESRRPGNIVEKLIETHGAIGRLSLPSLN